jgi:cysteinyl-tRNA synthetase
MDLAPTHHTNEIAQNIAYCGKTPARFWMHTNMLTVNGQKMSKSLGNSILPQELFSGNHPLLSKGYSPMVVRFFMLQSHYRSTLDISDEALNAAEKGFERLMESYHRIPHIKSTPGSSLRVLDEIRKNCLDALNDDLNTAVMLSHLFELSKVVNSAFEGKISMNEEDKQKAIAIFDDFLFQIGGIRKDEANNKYAEKLEKVMDILLSIRKEARQQKNFALSDTIRDALKSAGIEIKDHKDNTTTWHIS